MHAGSCKQVVESGSMHGQALADAACSSIMMLLCQGMVTSVHPPAVVRARGAFEVGLQLTSRYSRCKQTGEHNRAHASHINKAKLSWDMTMTVNILKYLESVLNTAPLVQSLRQIVARGQKNAINTLGTSFRPNPDMNRKLM